MTFINGQVFSNLMGNAVNSLARRESTYRAQISLRRNTTDPSDARVFRLSA